MSIILTKELAAQAVQMVRPSVEALMMSGRFKRPTLHIVIGDPSFKPHDANRERCWRNNGILHQETIGNTSDWERPYDSIALSKTYLSWQHGMPTQILQARCPHLLEYGDTTFFGSAVRDGLVVGVSGVQPYFDQMVAEWVLEACRALCIEAMTTGQVETDKDGFIV